MKAAEEQRKAEAAQKAAQEAQQAAAAAQTAAAAAEKRVYVVKPGDSLSVIAQRELGAGRRWPEIYELNKEVIGANPNLIRPGQKLVLPD